MSDTEETWPLTHGNPNPAAHVGSLHRWGAELEFELPAGTVIRDRYGSREHVLLAPVRVRSAQPCTVWEGVVRRGSPEDAAWPKCVYGEGSNTSIVPDGGIASDFVRLEDVQIPAPELRRAVAMLRLSQSEIPAWLSERVAAKPGPGFVIWSDVHKGWLRSKYCEPDPGEEAFTQNREKVAMWSEEAAALALIRLSPDHAAGAKVVPWNNEPEPVA